MSEYDQFITALKNKRGFTGDLAANAHGRVYGVLNQLIDGFIWTDQEGIRTRSSNIFSARP